MAAQVLGSGAKGEGRPLIPVAIPSVAHMIFFTTTQGDVFCLKQVQMIYNPVMSCHKPAAIIHNSMKIYHLIAFFLPVAAINKYQYSK
jgi:hypothetical protein